MPAAGPRSGIDMSEMARLEALAEQFYTDMYDSRHPRTEYEDACYHFHLAIAQAQRLGLASEVARLSKRRDHVGAVYTSQFRGF